jgi:hypothetical protein
MDVTRTVFGIYYPETRRIVEELWDERPHAWYERNYTGRQDAMHRACLARWRTWVSEAGVRLGDGYPFECPTAGASEGIHALLALHRARGGRRIHVLEGEYEGYAIVAAALGLDVMVHRRADWRESISRAQPGDQVWISQPSAIDGNLWSDFGSLVDHLSGHAPGVRLAVDLTYVGAVAGEARIDLESPSIDAVVWSLSKPFGVYYHRIGGLVARDEIPTLRGHHWFKNLFSLQLGERLMTAHPAGALPARYRDHQREALARTQAAGLVAADARASDVVMLAHAPGSSAGEHAAYARGPGLRFCLSPLMDRMINP